MEDGYYTRIENPVEFRKTILNSSKSVIMSLKEYHTMLTVRKDKLVLMDILKEQIKEIIFLLERLDEVLPDRKIPYERDILEQQMKESEKKEPEKQPEPEKKHVVVVNHNSDMDKLEQALAGIERKLNQLN